MLTKAIIDQFYKDVESLGLEHPVAALEGKTGVSKGQISKVLSRKLKPSKALIDKFYESFNLVSFDKSNNEGRPNTLTEALEIIKQQNAFLQRLVESNLASLSRDVNNNASAIQAEIRGYGKYQILKQSNWDDQEFAKAMAVVDRIYGEELRLDDGQGNPSNKNP